MESPRCSPKPYKLSAPAGLVRFGFSLFFRVVLSRSSSRAWRWLIELNLSSIVDICRNGNGDLIWSACSCLLGPQCSPPPPQDCLIPNRSVHFLTLQYLFYNKIPVVSPCKYATQPSPHFSRKTTHRTGGLLSALSPFLLSNWQENEILISVSSSQ